MLSIRPLIRKNYHGEDFEAFNSSRNIAEELFTFSNKSLYKQLSHQSGQNFSSGRDIKFSYLSSTFRDLLPYSWRAGGKTRENKQTDTNRAQSDVVQQL